QTAQVATMCAKCQKIFVPAHKPGDEFPDKCPKCGYSEIQYRQQLRKDQPPPPSGIESKTPTPGNTRSY
ncbi:MAG: hypothetical protein KAT00_12365, partial [Planctomycetes bacterium]|nr:hypothetical protein [Planctomycetota bacterium]